MNLDHIKMMAVVAGGPDSSPASTITILFNSQRVSKAEAIHLSESGIYSPYVLALPTAQFFGLFRNEEVAESSADTPNQNVNLKRPNRRPDGTIRRDIRQGALVDVVLKKDQPTGALTRGVVKDILTNSPQHHRGIKVRLEDGQIGRVQAIICSSSAGEPRTRIQTRYETLVNMSLDEMTHQLIPFLAELCEDGVPCEDYIRQWLDTAEGREEEP